MTTAEKAKNATSLKCPVCKGESHRFLYSFRGSHLYLCEMCGVRFSDLMEHPGENWYEESDIYKEVQWNVPAIGKLKDRWEFKKALDLVGPPKSKVLDIGCGRGDFLKVAMMSGCAVVGVDLNKPLLDVGKKVFGITDLFHGTFEDYAKNGNKSGIHTLTAFEVLEHLPDPGQFVENCYRFLPNNGRLILSVPGYHRWPHWVRSPVDMPPHHFTLWSEKGLTLLLQSKGFYDVITYRKPLLLGDVMYHVVRWFPVVLKPGFHWKIIRGGLKVCAVPFWLMVRLVPRAGGFTLFGTGRK